MQRESSFSSIRWRGGRFFTQTDFQSQPRSPCLHDLNLCSICTHTLPLPSRTKGWIKSGRLRVGAACVRSWQRLWRFRRDKMANSCFVCLFHLAATTPFTLPAKCIKSQRRNFFIATASHKLLISTLWLHSVRVSHFHVPSVAADMSRKSL